MEECARQEYGAEDEIINTGALWIRLDEAT
jgi:hypothetical protein